MASGAIRPGLRHVSTAARADHMRTELVLGALQAALGHREPSPEGMLFHSDRGSQYAADDYREALRQSGITCSMSRKGNCWDKRSVHFFKAIPRGRASTSAYRCVRGGSGGWASCSMTSLRRRNAGVQGGS